MGIRDGQYVTGYSESSVYAYPYNGNVNNKIYSGIGPANTSTSSSGCYLNNKLYVVVQGSGNSFIAIYSSNDISTWTGLDSLTLTRVGSGGGPPTNTTVYNPSTRQCSGFITPYNNNTLFFTTSGGIYKFTISPTQYSSYVSRSNLGNIICYDTRLFVADHTSNSIKIYSATETSSPSVLFDITNPMLANYVGLTAWSFGMTLDNIGNFYLLDNVGGVVYKYEYKYICFKKDTQILTQGGYKPIQDLRKGDLVKTSQNGYKPIYKIGYNKMNHPASEQRIKDQLYKCSTENFPEVFEDLVITGCHCILVDNFKDEKERKEANKINNVLDDIEYITENKCRLPACVDERTTVYEVAGEHTIYHFALENDDYYMNYGVYANGLLVESTSKRFMDDSSMTLVE
jgi:hypothetical protein